ncbi:hypothetical protein GGI13_000777 [Coemansia sp. RSA 455]|nr:hypothetical protein GGI13_000777 [Coemansia sp. RSA 455]
MPANFSFSAPSCIISPTVPMRPMLPLTAPEPAAPDGVYNGEWDDISEAKYYSQGDASVEAKELMDIINELT